MRRTRLSDIGEDLLLAKLLRTLPHNKRIVAGAGDDAAIVAGPAGKNLVVLKTDCVVEGIHFAKTAAPRDVGWKAMMRPLSDFAAVSGLPEYALITLITRSDKELGWIERMYRGLNKAAARFDVRIVGGETSRTAGPTAISVCVVGSVEKDRWVSRGGARPGDDLFVTGRLGASISAKHLRFVPRIGESRWLTANFRIQAMMDISDGLGADLPRLARASKVGFRIDESSLPRNRGATIENAISDGEDYELLFAISPRDRRRLQAAWRRKFPRLPLARIGCFCHQSTVNSQLSGGGYVHFQ